MLGSRGSVLPLFQEQVLHGGPLTVTHQESRRYFMTIPEAASLVLQAGAGKSSGQLFVLDMGHPVRIVDLAEDIIRLYGLEPYTDVNITFCGLRAGEKLNEELLFPQEQRLARNLGRMLWSNARNIWTRHTSTPPSTSCWKSPVPTTTPPLVPRSPTSFPPSRRRRKR